MGLFKKHFGNGNQANLAMKYALICQAAAQNISLDPILNESETRIKFEVNTNGKVIANIESLIISFILICNRLQILESNEGGIVEYLTKSNMNLKRAFHIIIDSVTNNEDVSDGIKKYYSKYERNDHTLRDSLLLYFVDRIFDYRDYIDTMVENKFDEVEVLNISELFENPFSNRMDLNMYTDNDFIFNEEELMKKSAKKSELIFSINNSNRYIKNIIK